MRHLGRTALVVAFFSATAAAQTLTDTRLRWSNWVTGLSAPTAFAWIGPGEMLVIQKNNGRVRWVKDGVILGDALDLAVDTSSERGGLGIAADPDFANNGFVYVYYSKSMTSSDNGGWLDNRVERYTWNGATLGNVFGPLVAFPMDSQQSNGPNHDGGIIRFGPDGKLYGQTGDLNRGRFGGKERVEQNTATTGSADVGGIFRLNTDGTIPSDNPFTGESDAALHLWWSYGLRNGYGMTWDRVNGELWNTENGPNLYDEVCRVPKGMNSGWLKIMGPDSRDATYGENGNMVFDESDLVVLQNSAYLDPVFSFKTPVGITAIEFIASKLFPTDLVDDCLFADNNNGNLYFCELQSGRTSFKLPSGLTDKVADTTTERNKIVWGTGWGVVTDAQMGPHDGYLYVVNHITNRIYRVRPVTDGVDPAWRIDPGLQQQGEQANAEESDDKTWNLAEVTFARPPRPFVVGATFKLNSATPTAITVQVETRYGRIAVPQAIHALNRTTGSWDLLDATTVGKSDVALSLPLATPADYIDPVTLKVELRLTAKPPAVPPRLPRKLTLLIDLFRLDVTYP